MKKCPNCGADLDEQAQFCSKCGAVQTFDDDSMTLSEPDFSAPVQPADASQKSKSHVLMILIIVVLIGLVIIFKTKITEVVNSIFEKIVSQSSSV